MDKTQSSTLSGWLRVIIIILPYFIVVGLFQFIGLLITGADLQDRMADLNLSQDVIITLLSLTGTVLLIWLFRKLVDKESFISIGLRFKGHGKDILWGVLLGLFIMGLGFGLLLLLGEIQVKGIVYHSRNLLLSFALFIIVALNEELFVRGYVLNNLMMSVNKYLALLISSVAFAAMHIPNPHFSLITFFILVLSGIILGLSYLFTKNLWFPIALHFSWNFFQGTVFGFNVSGQDDYSLIEQFRAEDNIINGGLFGFEGSLLCIGMLILGTFIVWKIFYTKDPPSGISPSAEELIENQNSIL